MKRAGKTITGLVLCVLLLLAVTGCKKEDAKEPVNIALLIGNHANMAAPNLSVAEPYIKEACESFGYVSIIAIDGAPYQSAQADIRKPKKNLSDSKLESITVSMEEEIIGLAEGSVAKSPEVDTLKAIELGVRSLRSREDGKDRMLVLDSGVCTAGSLDLTGSLLDAVNPDKTAKSLKDQNALPSMKGIEVIWAGIGDTQAPQKPLSSKNVEVLKEVWEKVLTAAGAKVTFVSDLPTEQSNGKDLPKVTSIEVLKSAAAINEDGYSPYDTLVLDQEALNFKPDSDELLTDMESLESILSPIAEYMKEEKGYRILLCGTTATSGGQDTSVELSKRRCDAVKQILVSMGVKEGQIMTLGLGYVGHPFHIDDMNDDGSLNEEIAKRNRSVIILPEDSEIARLLSGSFS